MVSLKYILHDTSLSVYSTLGKKSAPSFHLIKKEKTWLGALKYCREKHTDLVSGVTQLRHAKTQLSKKIEKAEKNIAIGLFRDSWDWSGGSKSSFRNWDESFKDHRATGNCAVTSKHGEWKSKGCSSKFPFFCYNGEC